MTWGSFAWNASQRRALLLLLSILLVYLCMRYACNTAYVSDPQPEVPSRFGDLADRIDPNTADWSDLAALPSLGEKRAREIVAYRETYRAEHHGNAAFTRPEDLLRMKGIGVAMLATLEPYLVFPSDAAPTTQRGEASPSIDQ